MKICHQVATSNSQMPTRTLQEHVSMLGFNGSLINTSNLSMGLTISCLCSVTLPHF